MKHFLKLIAVIGIVAGLVACSSVSLQKQLYIAADSGEHKDSYMPSEVGRTWVWGYSVMGLPAYVVSKVVGPVNPGDPNSPMLLASRSYSLPATTDQKMIIGKGANGLEVYRFDVKVKVGGMATSGVGVNLGVTSVNTPPMPVGPQGHKAGDKWSTQYTNLTGMDPVSIAVSQFGDFWNDRLAAVMKAGQNCKLFENEVPTQVNFVHMGSEKIDTELGEFDTIKIKHWIEGTDSIQIDNYAKGIGLVKQRAYTGGNTDGSPIFEMTLLSTLPADGDSVFNSSNPLADKFDYQTDYKLTKTAVVDNLAKSFDDALAGECKDKSI